MSKPSHMALERIFMNIDVWKNWQGAAVRPSSGLLHYRWRYASKFLICNFNQSAGYLQRRRAPITQTLEHCHSVRWHSADVSFWLYVTLKVCICFSRCVWDGTTCLLAGLHAHCDVFYGNSYGFWEIMQVPQAQHFQRTTLDETTLLTIVRKVWVWWFGAWESVWV